MIHDEIYQMAMKVCALTPNTADGANLRDTFLHMFNNAPIGFYFDDTLKENLELWHTAQEFAYSGLLKLPFENCIFHVQDMFAGMEGAKTPHMTIALRQVDENEITYLRWKKREDSWVTDAFIGSIDMRNKKFNLRRLREDIEIDPKSESVLTCLGQLVMIMMMMMNHPVYEKKEHDIPEKLQRARAKKGKEPLSKYIYIGMKPEIRSSLQDGDGGLRAPHWRRGHVRRLGDGRVVPVQACLVNWEGNPDDIQKKIYVMKGQNK